MRRSLFDLGDRDHRVSRSYTLVFSGYVFVYF